MPKLKLTAPAVMRLKCPKAGQLEYFDELLPSFGLRLSYSGTKSWFVMTRVKGKLIRVTLGRHPAMSLKNARETAREVIATAHAGIDPRAVKRSEKEQDAERRRNTFGVLTQEFLSKYVDARLRPSTAREYRRILMGDDTRKLQQLPISEITKRDILGVVEGIQKRGSPGAADRALAYLRKFFNWCVDREAISASPSDRIKFAYPTVQRERVLSRLEIGFIWRAFETEGGLFGPLFQLLLLSGQRRGEVAGMCWEELKGFDGECPVWELPGDRTKNRRPHIVPLSSEAVCLIKTIPITGPYLFSTTGRSPVSGFGKAKARVDRWIAQNHTELPPWSLHDLRRTMVTMMNEELKVAPHIVEATVNHVSGSAKKGVAGIYNRALYLDERRAALGAWARFVNGIVGSSSKQNVVEFQLGA